MSSEIRGDDNFTTKRFVSTEQTITSAGELIIPHGLGVAPALIKYSLICKITDAGYSVGAEIDVGINNTTAATNRINTPSFDTTNITVRFSDNAACFIAGNKTTGVVSTLNNANWKLIVRAWP